MLLNVILFSLIGLVIWVFLTLWIIKHAVKKAIAESSETIARIIMEAREGRVYSPPEAGAVDKPTPPTQS